MSIQSGMLATCCMQYAMSLFTICSVVTSFSWWKVCVSYCDVFSLTYVHFDQL